MKRKVFLLFDVPILMSIVLFVSAAYMSLDGPLSLTVFILMFAVGLCGAYAMMIHYRRKIRKYEERERVIEAQVEKSAGENKRSAYNELKQRMLEDMIVAEVENKWPEAKVLKNVHVPKSDGQSTEIDVLVFDSKGIFVIEAKNLNAQIEGSWKENRLEAVYPNNDRHPLYNPIVQNAKHIEYLRSILGVDAKYVRNIVVFGQFTRFLFQDVPYDTQLCKVETLMKAMERLYRRFPCQIEDYKIERWHESLKRVSANNEKNSEIAETG